MVYRNLLFIAFALFSYKFFINMLSMMIGCHLLYVLVWLGFYIKYFVKMATAQSMCTSKCSKYHHPHDHQCFFSNNPKGGLKWVRVTMDQRENEID